MAALAVVVECRKLTDRNVQANLMSVGVHNLPTAVSKAHPRNTPKEMNNGDLIRGLNILNLNSAKCSFWKGVSPALPRIEQNSKQTLAAIGPQEKVGSWTGDRPVVVLLVVGHSHSE